MTKAVGWDLNAREIRVSKEFYVELVGLLKPEERALLIREDADCGLFLLSPFGQTLWFVPEGA